MRSASALFALLAGLGFAQSSDRLAYDVASVKLNTSGDPHSGTDGTTGQIVMTNLGLDRIIQRAFGVGPAQVVGPEWLGSVRADIIAKYPPAASAEDRMKMLQTLLENRFQMKVHRETRQMPGYAMVPAKSGFKLKPLTGCEETSNHNGGRVESLDAKCVSMDLLAELASRYLGAVVKNQTKIDGAFDFQLRWSSQDPEPKSQEQPLPTLIDELQEKLGLKLQAQKVPVEVIVVDHMERVPVGN